MLYLKTAICFKAAECSCYQFFKNIDNLIKHINSLFDGKNKGIYKPFAGIGLYRNKGIWHEPH